MPLHLNQHTTTVDELNLKVVNCLVHLAAHNRRHTPGLFVTAEPDLHATQPECRNVCSEAGAQLSAQLVVSTAQRAGLSSSRGGHGVPPYAEDRACSRRDPITVSDSPPASSCEPSRHGTAMAQAALRRR